MKSIKRRCFIGSMGGSFAAVGALDKLFTLDNAKVKPGFHSESKILENPNDVKLNVKPVYSSLVHSGAWEGPCRVSAGLSGDAERASLKERYKDWVEYINENISQDARILKPEYVEYLYITDNFTRNEKEFAKLEADKNDVDLYLIQPGNCAQVLSATIAKRFNKPLAMVTSGHIGLDAGGHLRNRGYEFYPILDDDEINFSFDELNHLIHLLKTRKVFQQLSMLVITNTTLPSVSLMCAVYDFDDLAKRFGIRTKIIQYKILTEEMESVMQDTDIRKKAEDMADNLIKNAVKTYLDRKYVISNNLFYYAVKNLMNRYNCNAFSIDCWEFCASRLPEKWKVAPCSVHSLLNDEGYTSACHNLLNNLLALRVMMTLANKSGFIGGLSLVEKEGMVVIGHNTPGLKMDGYDKPNVPYNLHHFCKSGWGAKISIYFADEFAANYDNIVTLVNIDAPAKRIIAASGELVRAGGYDIYGCALRGYIRFQNLSPREFMNMQADFGQHNVMVYGDYTKDIQTLGKMLGMEVIVPTA